MNKIDFDNYQLIGCIPIKDRSQAPTDQSPCTKESCKFCNELMWVSENKKKHLSTHDNCLLACFRCIIRAAKQQGLDNNDLELFDLTKIN